MTASVGVGASRAQSACAGTGASARVSDGASGASNRIGRAARAVVAWSASFAAPPRRAIGFVPHTSAAKVITLGAVISHPSAETETSSTCDISVRDLLVTVTDFVALRLFRSVHVLIGTAARGA